jgi:hypothetical protein
MSKYFEFKSAWETMKRDKLISCSAVEFYNMMTQKTLELAVEENAIRIDENDRLDNGLPKIKVLDQRNNCTPAFNRAMEECAWYKCGAPYYKVDNAAIELFRNIKIDIPFKYVKLPFDCFAIRFEEDNPLSIDAKHKIQTSLVSRSVDQSRRKCLDFWADVGEKDVMSGMPDLPVLNYLHILGEDEEIVQEQLLQASANGGDSDINKAGLEGVLVRIAISICFLATSSDKMIRPDVLGKDFAAWSEAERKHDTQRLEVIRERAKRKGKLGYFVDGAREFIHTREEEREYATGTGRELSHRHMRSAHFRIHHGDTVSFVRQHPVRPDLPSKV